MFWKSDILGQNTVLCHIQLKYDSEGQGWAFELDLVCWEIPSQF